MSAARKTVSMPEQLFNTAVERQRVLGYSSFSDYIQALIRADTIRSEDHVREAAPPYRVSSVSDLKATARGRDIERTALEKIKALRKKRGTTAPKP